METTVILIGVAWLAIALMLATGVALSLYRLARGSRRLLQNGKP